MKYRHHHSIPRTLVVCFAPLLACSSAALASVVNFNEQSTTNAWKFKPGSNLLAAAVVTSSAPLGNHGEGTSTTWTPATDGSLGNADGSDNSNSVSPANNTSVTYALDVVSKPTGYTITSFDAYGAWGDTGRDNLDFTIEYSTVSAPGTFTALATISNHTQYPGSPLDATHTSITDTTGVLATGVHSIRLNFANQENSYVGYREFILREEANPVLATNEANTTNIWTLPAGINLLNANNANSPTVPAGANHGNGDVTSSSWSVLTNTALGTPGEQLASVAPLNNTSVILPLDTSINFNGYNISSFDSYCSWPNTGRDNQDFAILYSTVAAPTTFIPLAEVGNHTTGSNLSTHTRLSTASGYLATGVAAIQIYFNNQENGYVGYREFIALGTAVSISDPLTWTGGSGSAGNANWTTAADNNWKKTAGGAPSNFSALAALTFDDSGANPNITLPGSLTASSLTFANSSNSYTLNGQLLTVSNDIVSTGTGIATFNNSVLATTGVTLSGAGGLVFNSALQAPGLTLSGAGGIILNAANPSLTGNISVSNGTLTVANNGALEFGALLMTGGTASFTSSTPLVASIAGTAGSVVLGNTVGPVNTNLRVGDANPTTTNFAGSISEAFGTVGRLTKFAVSSLALSGDNTYTGPTSVEEGSLEFGQSLSLYHGTTSSWTASNLLVSSGATLGFKVGGVGEFTESDLTNIELGGFDLDSNLGINTTADFTLSRNLVQPGVGLWKTGSAILTLTGNNTSTGLVKVSSGTLKAASPVGKAISGNLQLGDNTSHVIVNMGASNQFGPDSIVTMSAGAGFFQSRLNLRGTDQTIAGLESAGQFASILQNDEIGQPGYTTDPGPASLTINAVNDHSFAGIIRNANGGSVTVNKNGPGTQQFANLAVGGYNYNGPTNINEGTLKINFDGTRQTSWSSNINIASSGSTLEIAGQWNIFRTISGPGKLVKTGPGQISVCNTDGDLNANTYTGGTVIYEGTLKFYATNGSTGEGNVPTLEYCPAGPMDPSNVIQVKSGATLGVGSVACFGESGLIPEHGVTINIEPGGRLWGADGNNIAFVPNVHLDGATVEVTDGSNVGGFNTNMTFVGTVTVGGTSNVATQIFNSPGITGPNANISLGSIGLPGTVFQVDDVQLTSAADLLVYSLLKDVHGVPSPLTKTGAGTMFLIGAKSYTGATHVAQGELRLDTPFLADSGSVVIDNGAFLNLLFPETDTVNTLTLGGVQVAAGTYGSITNTTPGIIQTPRIKGDGLLLVTTGAPTDPYEAWASVISNPADRDKSDDPDGDGFTNLQEYLLGGSPVAPNGALVTSTETPSGLVVRWAERASGVYILQESTTLAAPWTTSAVVPVNAGDQNGVPVDYVRREATIPVDVEKKFVRIQAVIP